MRHAPPPASERQDPQPVTESLRETAGRVGRAVSTWLAMGLLAIGPAAALARAAAAASSAVYLLSAVVLSLVGSWAVLRYWPGATDQLWRFAVRASVVFVALLFFAPPTWRVGTIRDGSSAIVLLAWIAGVVVAVVLAYRDEVGPPTGWLSSRGDA